MAISIRNKFFKIKDELVEIIGDEPMYAYQITKICKDLLGSKYNGTFSQDKIPMNKEGYCIANTDTSGEPGTHWVALVFRGNKCIVFDSFGRNIQRLLPILKNKLEHRHIIEIQTDPKPEQFGNTNICGQLCIAFLICIDKYGIDNVIDVI